MSEIPVASASVGNPPPEFRNEYPAIIVLPIFWSDQDAYAHVNNIVYFRWFEAARIAYLDQAGLRQVLDRAELGPILASVKCNYRRQLNYPDSVHIGTRVTRVGGSSIALKHGVFSESQRALVADGESVVVSFSYERQKSTPVPNGLREAIALMERLPVEGL